MKTGTITRTAKQEDVLSSPRAGGNALLLAHAPVGAATVDRCAVGGHFGVGRNPDNNLAVRDGKTSGRHFVITSDETGSWIEDLGSTNGTFLNGGRVTRKSALADRSVIRAGQVLYIFRMEHTELLTPPPVDRYGMAGRFHVGPLIVELEEAALSGRHLLLFGPSGTGKELAAGAIAALVGSGKKPANLIARNAAGFASAEEATTSLFGVGQKVFSGVESRAGLIARAQGGILFLDEIHNLPVRVQRSLLRVIEDGRFSPIGQTREETADVRFIFASNVADDTCGLAHDLFARLRLVRIPALGHRVADVPSIFEEVLRARLAEQGLPANDILPEIGVVHHEALCLDPFPDDNVRGLIDLADRLATRIAGGTNPVDAVAGVFRDRLAVRVPPVRDSAPPAATDEPAASDSPYETHKDLIIETYLDREGNISATERALRARGVRCSRRWLGIFLEKWGVKEPRK